METQKITISAFVFSVVGFVAGYILTNSIKFNICTVTASITEASCINFYERVGDPLFYGMPALAIVFFLLLFIPQAFQSWKKFAKWFIPLAALVFVFYDGPSGGFSSIAAPFPYPEQLFKWISMIYVAVSAVIIIKHKKQLN